MVWSNWPLRRRMASFSYFLYGITLDDIVLWEEMKWENREKTFLFPFVQIVRKEKKKLLLSTEHIISRTKNQLTNRQNSGVRVIVYCHPTTVIYMLRVGWIKQKKRSHTHTGTKPKETKQKIEKQYEYIPPSLGDTLAVWTAKISLDATRK